MIHRIIFTFGFQRLRASSSAQSPSNPSLCTGRYNHKRDTRWVSLLWYGVEWGIWTLGTRKVHSISSAAPSATRTTLHVVKLKYHFQLLNYYIQFCEKNQVFFEIILIRCKKIRFHVQKGRRKVFLCITMSISHKSIKTGGIVLWPQTQIVHSFDFIFTVS